MRALRSVAISTCDVSLAEPALEASAILDFVLTDTFPVKIEWHPIVSANLFVPFLRSQSNGKNYATRESSFAEKDLEPCAEKSATSCIAGHRKAYTETQEARVVLTIWDLLFPLLKPPLVIDNPTGFDLPNELFHFQVEGVKRLVANKAFLLADEMGTGKTVMTCVALRLLFEAGKIKSALIVCPKSILGVWDRHLHEWAASLSVTVVQGNIARRKVDWRCPAHVYVTTYGTLRQDVDGEIDLLLKHVRGESTWGAVVVDEAHSIKNAMAGQTKAVHKVSRGAAHRWALTGTPIQNGVEDLQAIFRFLDASVLPAQALGWTADKIRAQIEPFFLRRQKRDVFKDLPEKLRSDEWLELDDDQQAEYESALTRERDEFCSGRKEFTKMSAFTVLIKLKQICNFVPGKSKSPKTEALLDHVREIVANGKKVLVFTQYKEEGVKKLVGLLEPFGVVTITGDTSGTARQRAVDKFQSESDVRVFLATVQTAGQGLTLTAASFVVHFDHWWNPAVAWQAEDRAHRHGQTETVNVYSYWMKGTVEEKIYKILERKGWLHEQIINGMSEKEFDEALSIDDLLEIFDLDSASVRVPTGENRQRRKAGNLAEIIDRIQSAEPREFVEIVGSVFQKALGYANAKIIDGPGDGGVDIRASKSVPGGVEWIAVQCKRTDTVGPGFARELLGVLSRDRRLSKAYLVASGRFTSACQRECEGQGQIQLIDGPQLARWVQQHGIELA